VNQGDVHWIDLPTSIGSALGYRLPFVVVPSNVFNRSRIQTVIVYPTTTNKRRARGPGNVPLNEGEANLPNWSIVNISQIMAVETSRPEEYIGTLSESRIRQIIDGIHIVIEPT
jgi:mRNA interferase MazF